MSFKRIGEKKGIALIMAMWIMTILVMVAASFAFMMRTEIKMATNSRNNMQAHYLARAGIEYAIAVLRNDSTDIDHLGEAWANIGTQSLGTVGQYIVTVEDETGKINLNMTDTSYLEQMIDDDEVLGWGSAKATLVKNYRNGGKIFETFYQVNKIEGIGEDILPNAVDYYTVYPQSGGDKIINVNTASYRILRGIPKRATSPPAITDAEARDIIDCRDSDSIRYNPPDNEPPSGLDEYGNPTNVHFEGAIGSVDIVNANNIVQAEADYMNNNHCIRTNSEGYFKIVSTGEVIKGSEVVAQRKIEAVVNRGTTPIEILYWSEHMD